MKSRFATAVGALSIFLMTLHGNTAFGNEDGKPESAIVDSKPTNAKTKETPAPAKSVVLVQDLEAGENVNTDTRRTLNGFIVGAVNERSGLEVLSTDDIRRMADIQAERITAGCEVSEACLAELADAVGARYVIYGRAAILEDTKILELNLLDSQNVQVLKRLHLTASSFAELGQQIDSNILTLLKPLEKKSQLKPEQASVVAEVKSKDAPVASIDAKQQVEAAPQIVSQRPAGPESPTSEVEPALSGAGERAAGERANPEAEPNIEQRVPEPSPNWLLWGGGIGVGAGLMASIASLGVGAFFYWQFENQLADVAVTDEARAFSARGAFGAALISGAGAALGLGGTAVAVAGVTLE